MYRVLHIIPGKPDGTEMPFARRQVKALLDYGLNCDVFFLDTRTRPIKILQCAIQLRKKVAQYRPQLIHAQFGSITALFSAIFTKLPLVITFRGSDLNPDTCCSTLRSACQNIFSQLAVLRCQAIICVSRQLKDRLWWKQDHAVVLPTGFNHEIFRPMPQSTARERLGWNLADKVVLFNAGRSARLKRLDLAQSAVTVAEKLVGEIRFEVMRGDVHPDDVPLLMNAADCLVVTSDYEGSPTVVQEAIACNLPVVSVDVGDVRERLVGIKPSFIVARDAQVIGKAISEVLKLRARSNGWENIQHLTAASTAKQIVEIYDNILHGK